VSDSIRRSRIESSHGTQRAKLCLTHVQTGEIESLTKGEEHGN
jgi:hypothetical protein